MGWSRIHRALDPLRHFNAGVFLLLIFIATPRALKGVEFYYSINFSNLNSSVRAPLKKTGEDNAR